MAKELSQILRDLLKLDGVEATLVASQDGFVIDSSSNSDLDMEGLGAMVAMAIGGAESMGREFELGSMEQYMVEFQRGKVLIATAGDAILAVVADDNAVIGSIRYNVKKTIPDIAKAL